MNKGNKNDTEQPNRCAAVTALLALFCLSTAFAGVYKWTDEKGVVHYADSVPPEYVNRATVQINQQGLAIKKNEAALTPEQRKAIEDEEAKKKQAAKDATEQKRRDEALLNSYTDEKEIDIVRRRNISVVDGVITSTQRRIDELRVRRKELDTEGVTLQRQGKVLDPVKLRELKSIDGQLPDLEKLIAQKTREVSTLRTKYDDDLRRYRELTRKTETVRQ